MAVKTPIEIIKTDVGLLAYRIIGNGPRVLLGFHGFGQSSAVFDTWQACSGLYTLYAFDLFFHGKSQWTGDNPIKPQQWQHLIEAFLAKHAIGRFSVLGFSLGARPAMLTAQQWPQRIEAVWLVAPDGITPNGWFRLATGTRIGRWLMSRALARHQSLLAVARQLNRMGLVDKAVLTMVDVKTQTPQKRQQIQDVWLAFRYLNPNVPLLARQLNQTQTPIRFIVGEKDTIVPKTHLLPLTRRLHHYELTILPMGHYRLLDYVGPLLCKPQ